MFDLSQPRKENQWPVFWKRVRRRELTGGNRGPAAEPGKPDHSRLFQALAFTGDLKMPPLGKLKPEEIAVFQALGGGRAPLAGRSGDPNCPTDTIHALVFSTVETACRTFAEGQDYGRATSIDHFILAPAGKGGPDALARSRTALLLIRRLSLDLLGLPPSTHEVVASWP